MTGCYRVVSGSSHHRNHLVQLIHSHLRSECVNNVSVVRINAVSVNKHISIVHKPKHNDEHVSQQRVSCDCLNVIKGQVCGSL